MSIPKLFRVTVEVGDLESATELYQDLFGGDGERHRGARHYSIAAARSSLSSTCPRAG